MYYFIVNPSSRTRKGKQIWLKLKTVLEKEGISYQTFFTSRRKNGTSLALSICKSDPSQKIIVIVGGDGTVNQVINGISDPASVILGYIPTGSGNDFGRGLGIPKDPIAALHQILYPTHFKYVDCGILSLDNKKPRRFLISSGVGYDASICKEAMDSPLKTILNTLHLGKLTYLSLGIRQLLTAKPFDASLLIDGHTVRHHKKTLFLAAMNERYEGGGLAMAPDAKDDDGLLSVCIVSGLSKLHVFFLIPTIFFGKHICFKGIDMIHCHSLEVTTSLPQYIHTDGEVSNKESHLQLLVEKQYIRILASH